MDVSQAVRARRSIRAFAKQPIARQTLQDILWQALWAPSWGNTQPWKLTLVGGAALESIKQDFAQLAAEGVPTRPDLTMPTSFGRVQVGRYKELGKQLFTKLGIARNDKVARQVHYENMTRFFDAPCVLYLHLDKGFNPYALMDCGIILQTVALLAVEQGVGSCFLARSCSYPDTVRRRTGMADDQVLVMGMALGMALEDDPANIFRSSRGTAEEFIRLVGLE